MANFVANTQFSIEGVDLGFYIDNISGGDFEEDSNLTFFGSTYPDHLYVLADDGSESRRLDIYGQNITVGFLGTPTGGTISAVGEFDINAGIQRWYATGFSADAVATFNAATSASTADDISVIQNALAGADTITLSAFSDTMSGFGGDDSMKGGGGDDILDGGTGSDTAIYDSSFAQATISFDGDVLVISTASEGTDRLSNFEFVNFNGDIRSVVSLLPPNDPPVPVAATASATEDGAVVTGQLQATDANGDTLTFSIVQNTVAGLSINPSGSYSFNPTISTYQSLKAGETKQFVATYSVSDGRVSANSTLTINVTGVNDAPTFVLDARSLSTTEGLEVEFDVAASDFDGDTLTYTPSAAGHGVISQGAPGSFTYAPNAGFTGADTFTVNASDGKGGTATQTFTVTIEALNSNPVISNSDLQISTLTDTAKTFTVVASDPDGDPLTFSAADPAHGSIAIGDNGQLTYTPDNGYAGSDSLVVTVSDGRGGTAMQTFAITVSASNSPPVIAATGLSFSTSLNTAKSFIVSASDPNGDTLTYSAADPEHGTVTGGTNGEFVYTPDNGFTGTDSFIVTVTDGNGGSDVETFMAMVSAGPVPAQRHFALLASDGFMGAIGGYGNVFGTIGTEDITILDRPGALTFDPSFNKGGDVIRLSGAANDWQISRSGSTAILSDGDTFLEIPTGTTGMAIAFEDGIRVLRIDTQIGSLKIGSQAFAEEAVQIISPAQDVSLPTGLNPNAFANVILQSDGEVIAGGVLSIFGTSTGQETVDLLFGDVDFDPSFNKGGDLIILNAPAETFGAKVVGSGVVLASESLEVSIPAGLVGIEIEFEPGDQRLMYIDTDAGAIVLGSQQLGVDPIVLATFV